MPKTRARSRAATLHDPYSLKCALGLLARSSQLSVLVFGLVCHSKIAVTTITDTTSAVDITDAVVTAIMITGTTTTITGAGEDVEVYVHVEAGVQDCAHAHTHSWSQASRRSSMQTRRHGA